ncbi:Protein translocase subunit SecA, partial [Clarias magur]
YNYIGPGGAAYYDEGKKLHCYIHFRYENHNWDSFVYEFNTHKGDARFTLSETPDRSQIQLYCTSEGISQYCPNH